LIRCNEKEGKERERPENDPAILRVSTLHPYLFKKKKKKKKRERKKKSREE